MIHLSLLDTFLSLAPLALCLLLFVSQLQRWRDLAVAALRMIVQLALVGYLLSFLFGYDHSWLGLMVMLLMSAVSASIALRPLKSRGRRLYGAMLVSLLSSSALHLFWIVVAVLQLTPWYQPRFVIPMAGMILANGMNALSLGAERFESELGRMAFGEARRKAFNAAMIPQINALMAVGIVSLPGMMTGQILSGVPPLEAVRYQIMVMSMVAGNAALCLTLFFALVNRWGLLAATHTDPSPNQD